MSLPKLTLLEHVPYVFDGEWTAAEVAAGLDTADQGYFLHFEYEGEKGHLFIRCVFDPLESLDRWNDFGEMVFATLPDLLALRDSA